MSKEKSFGGFALQKLFLSNILDIFYVQSTSKKTAAKIHKKFNQHPKKKQTAPQINKKKIGLREMFESNKRKAKLSRINRNENHTKEIARCILTLDAPEECNSVFPALLHETTPK